MSTFLPFVVIGLTSGSIYGLAAVGLVLTYKTSGIFNFAHGSIAAIAAFVFYFLYQQHHVAWPLALILCCVLFGGGLGWLFELLARSLGQAANTIKVVGTIGLVLIVLSIATLWYPGNPRVVTDFLPTGTVLLAGVYIQWDQIIIFTFAVCATGLLYWFFGWFRLGIAMRAVVDNPQLLARTGESPVRVRRWAWGIGNTLAAISGILLALGLNLDALSLTTLVVQAFGAAAIGAFTNLPLTFVGGLGIGVAGSLVTEYTANYPSLGGLASGLPFIILFVVLIAMPKARLIVRSVRPVVEVHRSWYAPVRARTSFGILVVAVLALVPTFAGVNLINYSDLLVMFILLLSLGLLVKTSGQVSLCQFAFAGVGAATMGHFTSDGIPWLLSVLLAALVVVPVGAIVAIPAIRLSGVFLALATFGFGILLEQVFFPMNWLFGSAASGIQTARPSGSIGPWHFGTSNGYYYVLLVAAVVTALALVFLERGRLGRLLRAMADSPLALQSGGTALLTTRVLVFCISAFFAGLSGALSASLFQNATSTQYDFFSSLTLFALLVIVVVGEPWYALVASLVLVLLPAYLPGVTNINTYLQLLFGVSAVFYVFAARRPLTVPAPLKEALQRLGSGRHRLRTPAGVDLLSPAHQTGRSPATATARSQHVVRLHSGLEVNELTVRYGGVVAVDGLTLSASLGTITGLIGPNGAGKTTTFAACSGLIRPSSGRILLGGRDISKAPPEVRARLGLGRTFQRVELYDSLTVAENVAMGCEAALAGGRPWRQLLGRRGDNRTIRAAVEEAIAVTGIDDLRGHQVGLLSTGQQRLVELARALAGPYDFLLLDEPSSGLDASESRHFGQTLRSVVQERGTGILLVEHDMTLVRDICSHIYVLDYGALMFRGTPEEMRASEVVRAAYLGTSVDEPQALLAGHGPGRPTPPVNEDLT